MIQRALLTCAYVCCGLVLASFVLFGVDQLSGASKHQVQEIATGATTTPGVAPSDPHRTQPRRFIDGAASVLTSPFKSIIQSNSEWAQRIFVLVCALFVYGLGLGYLSRYARGLP